MEQPSQHAACWRGVRVEGGCTSCTVVREGRWRGPVLMVKFLVQTPLRTGMFGVTVCTGIRVEGSDFQTLPASRL